MIDVATLKVTVYPARSHEWIVALGWSDDGKYVWTESRNGVREWLDLDTGNRRPRAAGDAPNRRPTLHRSSFYGTCPSKGFTLDANDTGIYLLHEAGTRVQLVALDGRRHGYEDVLTFRQAWFSPSCENVVFSYNEALWVVNVATKRVGTLVPGTYATTIPALPLHGS